ncbi:hypothetical protein SAMN03159489_00602 [Pseudomonas sp. NFPP07]|nr:hypothetical protein C4K27_4949 [Pseudomonas chlororaphis subsp. chlororaphis]MCP1483115.1 hypothetical protein [Pseudomonas chlororaphis]SFP24742.1 hypothetical protein SAMN03159489_00602 [Pseudomonas sp. NFPP07]
MEVLSTAQGDAHCPLPRVVKTTQGAQPDRDLLLFMFGLTQGMRPQS